MTIRIRCGQRANVLIFSLLAAAFWLLPADAAVWYVNDTSTVGDSYTTSGGADTQPGTIGAPLRNIQMAIDSAASGDTIYVDRGIFDSYVTVNTAETAGINIDKDSIAIIGMDAGATIIDPPGAYTTIDLYGVYADTQTGLLIKNIGVTGVYGGIFFYNVDASTIESDSAISCGYNGIFLRTDCETNTIRNNTVSSNSSSGIYLFSSSGNTVTNNTAGSNADYGIWLNTSSGNTVTSNTAASNTDYGIYLSSSSNNTVTNNTANSNTQYGIYLVSGSSNTVTNNTAASNTIAGIYLALSSNATVTNNTAASNSSYGIRLFSSSNNMVVQNDLRNNTEYQLYIHGSSSSDTVQKNNVMPSATNSDSGVYNSTGNTFDFSRNYWNTTDSLAIYNRVIDTNPTKLVIYQPYRLGTVDTTSGADTTAPTAPDSVAIIGSPSDTSIILEWSAVTALEEANGGAVGLSGYRVYRSTVKDTSSWIQVGQTNSLTIRYQDTDVTIGQRYYYRVTAFDTPALVNESFFSDSQPSDSAVLSTAVSIYVNDNSTTGDSWATAVGSDLTGNGTKQKPLLTITKTLQFATAGDTIFIDKGIYSETVVIGADSISLIGKDSNATVIDPPGTAGTAGVYGIYAANRTGLLIKTLGVTGAYYGIYFNNVDSSTVSGDSSCSTGYGGIYLANGSDANTVTDNTTDFAGSYGIEVDASSFNTISGNTSNSSSQGIQLTTGSNSNTLSGNTTNSHANVGIALTGSSNNTVSGNTANSNTNYGIFLGAGANNNTLSGNTAKSGPNYGIGVSSSSNNTLSGNTVALAGAHGVYLTASSNNTLSGNTVDTNWYSGVYMESSSDSNTVTNNSIRWNTGFHGIHLSSSSNNTVIQNDIQFNKVYQIYIEGTSSSETAAKNNFAASGTNPDSLVYNGSTSASAVFTFTRNWWNSTDTGRIKKTISQASNGDSVIWQPYRLGVVDTTAGADTVAPLAPDTAAVTPSDTSLIVSWAEVTANEDGNGGPPGASGGYTIWRSEVKDTSSWGQVGSVAFSSGQKQFQDTGVFAGRVYYYRVTTWDGVTPISNESFYSDSQPSDSAPFTSQVNWYVNDAWTAADSYTIVSGSDTGGNGSIAFPFRTITKAMQFATAGDTIYVDAGLYAETVVIGADSISLIGKDSNATVIDPPGAAGTGGLYGIYAASRTGLRISSLGVTGAYYGIYFNNVDQSTISGDSVTSCGYHGIFLYSGSDTNTLSGNTASSNLQFGIILQSSSNNTISNNTAGSNPQSGIFLESSSNNTMSGNTVGSNTHGIYLYLSSNNNTLSGNMASSNGSNGIFLESNSNNNTVANNTTGSNSSSGISLVSSSNNTLTGNTASSNSSYGIYLSSSSNNNTLTSNTASSNLDGIFLNSSSNNNTLTSNTSTSNSYYGVYLISSSNNTVVQNDVRNNSIYQVYIDGISSSDTVQKNNIVPSGTNPDSGVYNGSTVDTAVFTFTRNWWNSTDTDRIKKMIYQASNGDSVIWQPFRPGQVDTTAGGDTTAPDAPDTVAVLSSDTSLIVSWSVVTALEEANGGAVGLAGYRVYRSPAISDTSLWAQAAQVGSGVTQWQDTEPFVGKVYYYRVTAFDAASPYINESFYSDSIPGDSAPYTSQTDWYVNDGSTAGDSFTIVSGSDTGGNGSIAFPFRTITKAMQFATAGDTIFADAGLYAETVIITADSISLIGADSNATVVDPPGVNSTSGLYGIYATNRTGLLVKNIGVTGAYVGIYFYNVDLSTISGDSACSNWNQGINLDNGSDTNTVSGNTAGWNAGGDGIFVGFGSTSNTISGNTAVSNSNRGVYIYISAANTVTNNTAASNSQTGIEVNGAAAANNTVSNNAVNSNTNRGIWLNSGANNDTLSGNTVTSNGGDGGIKVEGSNNNTISNNTADSNTNNGIWVYNSSNNTLTNNTASSNTSRGILISQFASSAINNILKGNSANANAYYGVDLGTVSSNTLIGNMARNNTYAGVYVNDSDTNFLVQNDISGNDTGVWAVGASSNNTLSKNNISDNNVNNIYNQAGLAQTLTRNWFGSADSAAVAAKIADTASAWQPFRLGVVDTAAGADTTAPDAPDTVAVLSSDTSLIVSWSAVTALEEANGGAVGLSGYRVYRSPAISDTSLWAQAGQVGSGVTQWQDTSPFVGKVYYYRVTAYDAASPYINESFYSDSIPGDSAPFTSQTEWYVNDGSAAGDSYTYATGSDISGNGSKQTPFASIPRAMQFATAGDTIWIDAGLYDSYVTVNSTETAGVNIDKDSIALIGADSNATVIDPPGAAGTAGLYGVYADTRTGLTISNLGVTGAYIGILLVNVTASTIESDSAGSNGLYGIQIRDGADTNVIRNCIAGDNGNEGIDVLSSGFNTISGNTIRSNGTDGLYATGGGGPNTYDNNTIAANGFRGLSLSNTSNHTVSNNTVTASAQEGIAILGGASGNTIEGNLVASNAQAGILLSTASTGNRVLRNVSKSHAGEGLKLTNADSNLISQNEFHANDTGIHITGSSAGNTISRNNLIENLVSNLHNPGGLPQTLTRNWFGSADSVTIAARINDTPSAWQPYRLGAVDTASGADTVEPPSPSNLAADTSTSGQVTLTWNDNSLEETAFRIYRDLVFDTSSKTLLKELPANTTSYVDSGVTAGVTYYYSITILDSHLTGTRSFENEEFYSTAVSAVPTLPANTSGKWYVNDESASGDSFTYAVGKDTPTLANGSAAYPWRTITYALAQAKSGETIYIDAGTYTETVVIDTDFVALIGKDSNATVIDPLGAAGTAELYGIFADTQVGLTVKNIGITGAYDGIRFNNVDNSLIEADSVSSCGNYGIMIQYGSDTNTVNACVSNANTWEGIHLYLVSGNTVSNNTASSNAGKGILVHQSSANTISGNTADSNAQDGIALQTSSDNNTVTGNTTNSNTEDGIWLQSSSNNVIQLNIAASNAEAGIYVETGVANIIAHNLIRSNVEIGLGLDASDTNIVQANEITGSETGLLFYNASSGNVVSKNNILANNVTDMINSGGLVQILTRNWFGSTDEMAMASQISDTASAWRPYRLGVVDTAPGADTTAPSPPTGVALDTTTTPGAITLTWADPTINEETNGTFAFSGIKIYRLAGGVPDTTNWGNQAGVVKYLGGGSLTWTDTDVQPGVAYYYRLTSYDAAPFINESWFTDTKWASPALAPNSSGVWYVNDVHTGVEVYTSAGGSDTSGNGTAANPYRTISYALSQAKSGDTIYIDAGLYSETVVIDTDNLRLEGVDSAATRMELAAADSNAAVNVGIYADTQSGLAIKNIGMKYMYEGIQFNNVDYSFIENVTVEYSGDRGIHLIAGSDTNTLTSNLSSNNTDDGFGLESSNGNTLASNASLNNSSQGFFLNSSNNNTLSSNTSSGNTSIGFYLWTSCNNNVFTSNTSSGNADDGFALESSSNNIFDSNTSINNGDKGFDLYLTSNGNTLRGNAVSANASSGVRLWGSDANAIVQNVISANDTGVYIASSSAGNVISKNSILLSGVNHVYNKGGIAQVMTRNWWGTADESAIGAKFSDTASAFIPYRLGDVDTAAGADTTAPAPPTGVTLNAATPGQITVAWTNPAANEETNGGAVGFAGVRIYRLRNAVDTTHWANALAFTTSGAKSDWDDTGANDGATYYYRLSSFDGSSIVNQSWFTDTVFAASIVNGPASIQIVSGNHTLGQSGTQVGVVFKVLDTGSTPMASETVTFQVTYPSGGGGATLQLGSAGGPTDAGGIITETITLASTGDVFRIKASASRNAAANATATLYADGRDVPDSTWKMVGPNKKLLSTAPTIVTGDLGSTAKLYEWREDKGVNSSITAVSTKYHDPAAIERGRGFWAKQTSGTSKRWVVDEGTHGSAGFDTINIPLHAQGTGWNQIASGQYFYIDWQKSVRVDTGIAAVGPQDDTWVSNYLCHMLSVDSAHTSGVISKILYWYTGSAYEWGPNTLAAPGGAIVDDTSTVPGVQMKPMVGFWVKASQSCTLWVLPNPADVADTDAVILQQSPVLGLR
ncbi:right-handed parallel beta-helix repeat-containing protein, partial [bacterium]|nr:right-handed parallel beta-helix repeat-containing protein [bacterium]